ncbi:MAG: hypothetical protein AAGD25_14370 [Cyanobacteria bacterium P01_F01_bin.150]
MKQSNEELSGGQYFSIDFGLSFVGLGIDATLRTPWRSPHCTSRKGAIALQSLSVK